MCVLAISQNRERRNEYALEKLSDVDSDISPPNNHTTNIYIPLLHGSPCKPDEIVTDFVKYTLSPHHLAEIHQKSIWHHQTKSSYFGL